MRKMRERPSAEERRKFSMIWGEKTTTQQAIDIDLRTFSCESCTALVVNLPANTAQCFNINAETW